MRTYRETPAGLYVARDFVGHPRIRHWQAHLLPRLNVVVCRYDFHGRREHDFYLDVAEITCQQGVWTVRDLYLDLVLHDGLGAEIVDTDELLAAWEAGFVTPREVQRAVEVAHQTLSGLTHARYSMRDWLQTQGVVADWAGDTERVGLKTA